MVFTKLLLENALAIRPCNCEAATEQLLAKLARGMSVLSSRYIGKWVARVLKRSVWAKLSVNKSIYLHLATVPALVL